MEPYVKLNIGRQERSLLAQLRYGILQIQLETGRYCNEARENRLCKVCNEGFVEDQKHFLFHCTAYRDKRENFVQLIMGRIPDWNVLSDNQKLISLFNEHSRPLGQFVKDLFLYRKSILYK